MGAMTELEGPSPFPDERPQRITGLITLSVGIFILLAADLAYGLQIIGSKTNGVLCFVATLILATFIFDLLRGLPSPSSLKRLVLTGVLLIVVAQVISFLDDFAATEGMMIVGRDGAYNKISKYMFRLTGFCLLLPGLFLAINETLETKRLLRKERNELLLEIERREKTEAALREGEELYRDLFEHASDVVYTIDLEGNLLTVNKKGEELTGYNRGEWSNIFDLIHPRYRELIKTRIKERVEGKTSEKYEIELIRKNGESLPLEINTRLIVSEGVPIGIHGIARDITERRQAEAQRRLLEERIQKAQKTESLGILAGGIAHDFNNLLMGVLGNAELALEEIEPFSPARYSLEQIQQAAGKAAKLAHQMLDYSGKGQFLLVPSNLNEVTREMANLIEASLKKKATVLYELDPEVPMIECDATQIRQLILNLLTNAGEAIEDSAGLITVRTGSVFLDSENLSESFLDDPLTEGEYAFFEVSDTGIGMREETVAQMFDPFFSLKEVGRGLGLSAVLGIVRGHRGAIFVGSVPDCGTTIKICFPVASNQVEANPRPLSEIPFGKHPGTLLVVDDERFVRDVTRRILEKSGFVVLTAKNGFEALEVLKDWKEEMSLAIIDLTMPRLDGIQTLHRIRELRHDLPVLMMSGYNEEEISSQFEEGRPAGFVQKPFNEETLLAKVREVVGNGITA